jgi:succinylarginine dihydrolase
VTSAHEVNFDGLVGPTHNYAGLSYGNIASMRSKSSISSPKRAALEGLAKMKFMADLGLKQAVLPPHERPHIPTLRPLGFGGSDADVLANAAKHDPALLAAASSASAMWAANAATVSPSADTADGEVHFTPANLIGNLHRSIEAEMTMRIVRRIFADERHFAVHAPLPACLQLADEGAANHTRLFETYDQSGVEIFTFGREGDASPTRFPARQTLRASQVIARSHGLRPDRTIFVRQSSVAIDAGAFHNDVVAVGNRNLLLLHEKAWDHAAAAIESIRGQLPSLRTIMISEADVPLEDAIASYLFNSQLVTLPDGSDALIAPTEARENPRVRAAIEGTRLPVHFVDVRQSMRNGGGPACLRLRVVLTEEELAATHPGVIFTDALHDHLTSWIDRHYRDELHPKDLAGPRLLDESRRALDELSQILGLGPIYDFQR